MNVKKFNQLRDANPFIALNDVVYQLILDDIISFQILPGSRISANAVAQELGVSRSPVTAALEKLCEEGFVAAHNGRYYVTELDERSCKEMSDFMRMIEPYATGEAAVNITDTQLEKLYSIADDLQKYYRAYSNSDTASHLTNIVNHELAFHSLVVKASCNSLITEIYDKMKYKLFRFRAFVLYTYWGEIDEVDKDHRLICDILRLHDRDLATAIARRHIYVGSGQGVRKAD